MREFSIVQGAVTLAGGSTTSLIAITGQGPTFTSGAVNAEILRCWVGQYANATSAQQRVYLKTYGSSFPTVTTYTPNKLKPQDANASAFTGATYASLGNVGINASNENAGAVTNVHEDAFNVLNGWLYVPTPPETRLIPAVTGNTAQPGLSLAMSTVTTNSNWAFGCNFREV
jgi:hypothetical protein